MRACEMLAWRKPRKPDQHVNTENPVVKWRGSAAQTKSSDDSAKKDQILLKLTQNYNYLSNFYKNNIYNDLDFIYAKNHAQKAKHTLKYWEDFLFAVEIAKQKREGQLHSLPHPTRIVLYNNHFYKCVDLRNYTKWQCEENGNTFEYSENTTIWQHVDGNGKVLMTSKLPEYREKYNYAENLAGKPSLWQEPQFVVSPFVWYNVAPTKKWLFLMWNDSTQCYEDNNDQAVFTYNNIEQQWQCNDTMRKQLFGTWELDDGKTLHVQSLT